MSSNGKVRCGIIGAGSWATFAHLPALLQHPQAQVVAVQKRSLEAARQVADDFGVPHAFADPNELLALDGLDAVVVSSSPNMHYAQTRAALRRGLHVLLETPMTINVEDARLLVRLAESGNRQLLISYPWHHTRHALQARELIRSGQLGEIRMISVLMTNQVDHLIRGRHAGVAPGTAYLSPHMETYSDPAVAGGGQMYTQGSHAAAYLEFLTGQPAVEVFARLHNDGGRLDRYDAVSLRLSGGCLVSVASTGATPDQRRDYEVRVYGTAGMIALDLWRGTMEFVPMHGARVAHTDLEPEEIYPVGAPAADLVDSVIEGRPGRSPGSLGLAAIEVIEAAYESARLETNVRIQRAAQPA